jgi:hypothetical protein
MPAWRLIGGLAAGATFLAGRALHRRSQQDAAGHASGLAPIRDLSGVASALQQTALWAMAEGGFERRVLHGVLARDGGDVDVTAFDLETLRERRGEWAFLPVEPPFRIAGVVSIVVCEIDRHVPHVLLKHAGGGDALDDDNRIERMGSLAKNVRDRMGMPRSYESEMPATLDKAPLSLVLPDGWRAYSRAPEIVEALLASGFAATLEQGSRRDLVIELIDNVVVVYPAARDVVGPDAFADLTTTALQIVDGVLAASRPLTPRGIESQRPGP